MLNAPLIDILLYFTLLDNTDASMWKQHFNVAPRVRVLTLIYCLVV